MLPYIAPNDLVIYKPIKSNRFNWKKGSIVVANHPLQSETKMIKRIYNVNSLGVDIRGDNEPFSNDSRQFGLVNNENILGIVKCIISFD